MHNDSENFTQNSLGKEFPTTTTIKPAFVCFRLGRTINQFKRLCLPSTQPLSSVKDFEPTYSSINSLNTNEADDVLDEIPDDADPITKDNEDNVICEINLNADHHRLCKAKAEQDAVLEKSNASLGERTLTAMEAGHVDTKSLIAKLADVAKTIDVDVCMILAQQIKDPVIGNVRSWLCKGSLVDVKSPKVQQSKRLLR